MGKLLVFGIRNSGKLTFGSIDGIPPAWMPWCAVPSFRDNVRQSNDEQVLESRYASTFLHDVSYSEQEPEEKNIKGISLYAMLFERDILGLFGLIWFNVKDVLMMDMGKIAC